MELREPLAAYAELPEIVTVFRECDFSVLTGASWALDGGVANGFPLLARYKVPDLMVVEAKVSKSRILALKIDRDEAEIITFSARRTRVQGADEARAKAYLAGRNL